MDSVDELRFLRPAPPDPAGLIDQSALPSQLPYGLRPRHVYRAIEDVQDLIHQLNTVLHDSSYEPLEDLLDRASFSGLISRTIATRLAESRSGSLVVNQYHNGYPDLIPMGRYTNDAVQRGIGLEVKASRSEGSWQSHGPRPGWFIVVQFRLDESVDVARLQRVPTQIQAAMLADLSEDDWSWTPARAGRIRSGTASVKSSGRLKLRAGAVWVAPSYHAQHQALLTSLRISEYRRNNVDEVLRVLRQRETDLSATDIAAAVRTIPEVSDAVVLAAVRASILKLRNRGVVVSASKRGRYRIATTNIE